MNKRLAFTFIIITLTIDAMGIGLIIPVMPNLLQKIEDGNLDNSAIWGGILATVFAVIQFLFGPTIGSLSDHFDRWPVLLISLVIIAVDFIVMGLAHSIWLLVVTRIIGGIAAATQATAAAFISDISTPENRSANFGILGATFGIRFIFGPLIGGLLREVGLRVPSFAAAAPATLNLVLGYFVLPKTVTDQTRRQFDIKRANPLGAMTQIRLISGLPQFLLLFFLYQFAFYVYPTVWVYYAKAQFSWDSGMLGVSLASFGISVFVVEGILIRQILHWLGEQRTIVLGFMFNIMIFLMLGFLTSGFWALLLAPISALGSVVNPTMRGILANKGEANQQGEIQGIVSSAQ
jgi:DHA1 family tetracycline resistance protein-like MFS transporter